MIKNFTFSLLGIALSLAAAVVPAAAEPDAGLSVRVDLKDIDLANSDGMKLAYHRVRLAAAKACPIAPGERDSFLLMDHKACLAYATQGGFAQIDQRHYALLNSRDSIKTAAVAETTLSSGH